MGYLILIGLAALAYYKWDTIKELYEKATQRFKDF